MLLYLKISTLKKKVSKNILILSTDYCRRRAVVGTLLSFAGFWLLLAALIFT